MQHEAEMPCAPATYVTNVNKPPPPEPTTTQAPNPCQPLTPFFEMYALRKIHDSFKENKNLKDPVELQKAFEVAMKNLEMIKKQVLIGHLYSTEKLIIENEEIRKQFQLKGKVFTPVSIIIKPYFCDGYPCTSNESQNRLCHMKLRKCWPFGTAYFRCDRGVFDELHASRPLGGPAGLQVWASRGRCCLQNIDLPSPPSYVTLAT
ncbi:hypothetical protein PR048_029508 [Dryococelus australis]|uniref:Complex 1 LYR protein domain-containing protein n=1 Tax=Dryococelus australis TaxID=614101 RepID=A0ABQ9GDK2_9NEOP|nr:hypothetical protein PR048_029508 [Dryococelus australis]